MLLFDTEQTKISVPLKDGDANYYPCFMSELDQQNLCDHLWRRYQWEQPVLNVFGKQHPIPRLAAWVAQREVAYDYSGANHQTQAWTPDLFKIKEKIEHETGHVFNSVLLNAYRNGFDKMGWHSDDEKALGVDPIIASLNLGVMRRFDLRHKTNVNDIIKLQLEPGSLLLMGPGVQKNYRHQVPQQKKVEGLRINLTFRMVVRNG